MEIGVIGLHHHSAPIDIREQVAFTESQKITASSKLLDQGISEVVILSTCNRSEIYFYGEKMCDQQDMLIDFFRDFSQMSGIETYLYVKSGDEAISHLFHVSAGLDSLVLGEDQILGQVKTAHETALELGSSKKVLNRLFQTAIEAAKEIKTTTRISEQPLSISSIAIQYLKEKMGSFKGKNVMVIGTGEMSRLALKYLALEEVGDLYLASRNHEQKTALIAPFPQGQLIDYDARYHYFNRVDLVLSATASPHLVIKSKDVPTLEKEVTLLDLALPRDIDPQLAADDQVTLYNLDQLQAIREQNESKRNDLSQIAGHMIDEHVTAFLAWFSRIEVDATIAALNEKCDVIKDASIDFLAKKMALTEKEEKLMNSVMQSALKRLIREPILNLKQLTDEQEQKTYIQVTKNLFNLNV
ncbi:MAG: glutamyl-tRNA reductase [Defluviitaleaceae bacterium]|nr:glutamyl-tRNA reductase [Defluviitaleaceae bacterium]